MSVDELTIIKRIRNVLSDSSWSETAQSKTKKGNAVEETNSEDELSNLTLDGFRIDAGRILKTNRIQQTKHQLNYQSKKHD
jgi:regulator of replication initiation timing